MIKNRFKEAQTNRTLGQFEKGKLIQARKHVRTFVKIYNGLCPQCRAKVLRNPKMAFKEYCLTCQDMIRSEGGEE